jgi:hypothetical protein
MRTYNIYRIRNGLVHATVATTRGETPADALNFAVKMNLGRFAPGGGWAMPNDAYFVLSTDDPARVEGGVFKVKKAPPDPKPLLQVESVTEL